MKSLFTATFRSGYANLFGTRCSSLGTADLKYVVPSGTLVYRAKGYAARAHAVYGANMPFASFPHMCDQRQSTFLARHIASSAAALAPPNDKRTLGRGSVVSPVNKEKPTNKREEGESNTQPVDTSTQEPKLNMGQAILGYFARLFSPWKGNSYIQDMEDFGSVQSQCDHQMATETKMTLEDFRFHKYIGEGQFGKVFLASHAPTGYPLALKVIRKKKDDIKEVLMERLILKFAGNSPFVVHTFGAFQTQDHVFFVMEYIGGGHLLDFKKTRPRLEIATIRFIMAEIICALRYLHSCGIAHKDLKPENILLDSSGHVKIIDFGLSTVDLGRSQKGNLEKPFHYVGDYFSLGVIAYMLMTEGSLSRHRPYFPKDFDVQLQDLILKLHQLFWDSQETRQKYMNNLQSHPFFQEIDWVKMEAGEACPPFTMKICPPIDLTSTLKMENVFSPSDEAEDLPLSKEKQEHYCGFAFVSRKWGEIQRL